MANKKQTILDVALKLFSQRGYSAVSIRDICAEVGIKESSVYYHFDSKQKIFDALEQRFKEKSDALVSRLMGKIGVFATPQKFTQECSEPPQPPTRSANVFPDVSALDNNFFVKVCSVHIDEFLLDDFCNAFIRILAIERFSNPRACEIYRETVLNGPLNFQSAMFSYLMKIGVIPPCDGNYMAVQYYAPIIFYYEQYMLCCEPTEDDRITFRKKALEHIEKFVNS